MTKILLPIRNITEFRMHCFCLAPWSFVSSLTCSAIFFFNKPAVIQSLTYYWEANGHGMFDYDVLELVVGCHFGPYEQQCLSKE